MYVMETRQQQSVVVFEWKYYSPWLSLLTCCRRKRMTTRKLERLLTTKTKRRNDGKSHGISFRSTSTSTLRCYLGYQLVGSYV